MDAVDFFCAADDQHRVILLTDLLARAGQAVSLHSEAVARPTDPCVVACTRRALREPWIVELFTSGPDRSGPDVLAIRLDDAPLPGPCARVVDMQSWPARSADRKVGSVVRWLEHARLVKALRSGPDDPATAPSLLRRRPRRRRAPRDSRNLASLLVVLGLVAGTVALLWLAAPDGGSRPATDVAAPDAPAPSLDVPLAPRRPATSPPEGSDTAVEPSVAAAAQTGGNGARPLAGSPKGSPEGSPKGSPEGSPAGSLHDVPEGLPHDVPEGPPATESSVVEVAGPEDGDSLAHLCNARTVAAAEAWARALDWRQRRRAAKEPCVARLLERPGFQGIAALIERP